MTKQILFSIGLLSILIPSTAAIAEEKCPVPGAPEIEIEADLKKINKKLNWSSVVDEDVEQANCVRKNPFTDKEMNTWLSANNSPKKVSETINGISFTDESPENIAAFRYLTTAIVDEKGAPAKDRQKTFSSKCTKVDCAMAEIFGKDTSTQLLFMSRRFGMNGSQFTIADSAPWTRKELDNVLLTISDFPKSMLPIEKNRPLVKAKPGIGEEGVDATAVIQVFEGFTKENLLTQRRVLAHEFAHYVGRTTHSDLSEKWTKIGGWEKIVMEINDKVDAWWESSKPNGFVSEYAKTNPIEDFAESVNAYRYSPKRLKKADPKKYAYIKTTFFKGVEYTSPKACKASSF